MADHSNPARPMNAGTFGFAPRSLLDQEDSAYEGYGTLPTGEHVHMAVQAEGLSPHAQPKRHGCGLVFSLAFAVSVLVWAGTHIQDKNMMSKDSVGGESMYSGRLRSKGAMRSAVSLLQSVAATSKSTVAESIYAFGPRSQNESKYVALLNASLPVLDGMCLTEYPETYRWACLMESNRTKQTELEHKLSLCSWSKQSAAWKKASLLAFHGPPAYSQLEHPLDMDTLEHESCSPGSIAPLDTAAWEFHRIGPFNTSGGKDWTSVWSKRLFCRSGKSPLGSGDACKASNDITLFGTSSWPNAGLPLRGPNANSDPAVAHKTLAVTEYYVGAASPTGKLLGYPPLHVHHFHVEDNRSASDTWFHFWSLAAIVTHGDDQCVNSASGINCNVRRMPPGYATMMSLPLHFSTDLQDVRAAGSPRLPYYAMIALKGKRYDGTLKSLTQVRITIQPSPCSWGTFGTYLVPADKLTAYWREGQFDVTAEVRTRQNLSKQPSPPHSSLQSAIMRSDHRKTY